MRKLLKDYIRKLVMQCIAETYHQVAKNHMDEINKEVIEHKMRLSEEQHRIYQIVADIRAETFIDDVVTRIKSKQL